MPRWLTILYWSQPGRSSSGSYGVSALLHVAGLALLTVFWTGSAVPSGPSTVMDSRWTVDAPLVPIATIETRPAAATASEGPAGGRPAGPVLPEQRPSAMGGPVRVASLEGAFPLDVASVVPGGVNWGEKIKLSASGAGGLGGIGAGDGTADGDGNGGGFFGIKVPTRSVVFVIDASGSMNHPHDSFAKTRFRRLKFELAKCISEMDSETQFFIVFFNESPIAMPANSMVFATPAAKRKYMEWVASAKAVGETDPRGALAIALRLSPHAIYFLTDGSFTKKHEKELLKLPRTRTAIHTFAFGEEAGKDVLKQLAEKNGGRFLFVP